MSDLMIIGATKRITLGYYAPGARMPSTFTFWPNNPTKCPRAVFAACMKMKGSQRPDGSAPSPLEEYLESGVLFHMSADEANRIVDSGGMPISPKGDRAGVPDISPEVQLERTPEEKAAEAKALAMDPSPNEFKPKGDQTVKPPPAPRAG